MVILQRYKGDNNQTTGALSVIISGWPVFVAPCLERGFRDNKRNVSNVPAGIYRLVYEYSPRFKRYLWELKDVPGRSECKVHSANYWFQLNGCISPGAYLRDLNGDGYYDVAASKTALANFHRALANFKETTIKIIDPI